MVEPVGMAAIQDQNTGDPDKGAFDKRPIPDLNSQWVKPWAWLDKIARVAMLWVEKVAADRRPLTRTLALNRSAAVHKNDGQALHENNLKPYRDAINHSFILLSAQQAQIDMNKRR